MPQLLPYRSKSASIRSLLPNQRSTVKVSICPAMRRHFGNSATMIEKDIAPVQKKFQLSFSLRTSSKRSTFFRKQHPSNSLVHQTHSLAQQKDPQHQGHSYSCKEERMAVGEVCGITFSCDILKFAAWNFCRLPSPEMSCQLEVTCFVKFCRLESFLQLGETTWKKLRNCQLGSCFWDSYFFSHLR